MNNYLGEFDVDILSTRFADYKHADWVLEYLVTYGQIDGEHHKQWVIDQCCRILKGTPVIVKEARWENGHSKLCFHTGEPSKEYLSFVKQMKDGIDGPDTYSYDEGIAP
jgi:hypothetical protein